MSKMDALRAMREARYAATKTAAPTVRQSQPAAAKRAEPTPQPAGEDRCGHRNMSGRTCTRERGHAAKTHRYS